MPARSYLRLDRYYGLHDRYRIARTDHFGSDAVIDLRGACVHGRTYGHAPARRRAAARQSHVALIGNAADGAVVRDIRELAHPMDHEVHPVAVGIGSTGV